jgi:hypothetical protein
MSLFEEHIKAPVQFFQARGNSGIPTPLKKFSKVTNNIERGQNIIIGGRRNSGKTSYMDYNYFISVFKWWMDLEYEERPKIKFFYFSMKRSIRIKLQKWLCLYLKLEYNTIIDIPTLKNGVGKLYDLDDEVKAEIMSAYEFFNTLEDGHLHLDGGKQTPSNIFNTVEKYMKKIGSVDTHGNYSLNNSHLGQYTFVLIDNIEYLQSESDGFSMMTPDMLKKVMCDYLDTLSKVYGTTNIVCVPTTSNYSRSAKDTEPTYKDIGVFHDIADLGIVVYNPYNENNLKYCGYPIDSLVIKGKNRFRTATAVTNKEGVENQTVGLFFIGECGYYAESPHPTDVMAFEEKIEQLKTMM